MTKICESTFNFCSSLIKIKIPSSVKEIESGAFYECSSLKEVIFESSKNLVSIRSHAFKNCEKLSTISIPSSVNN